MGRGGGSHGEIEQATLISALISASHCSPWGSEVMEGLSLGLHREEGWSPNSPSVGLSRLTAKSLALQSLEVRGLQTSPFPLGSGYLVFAPLHAFISVGAEGWEEFVPVTDPTCVGAQSRSI